MPSLMRFEFETAPGGRGEEDNPVKLGVLADVLGEFIALRRPAACENVSASLSFLDEPGMRALNKRYRGVDESTDVLSFPLWEENGVFSPPADWPELPLGDVVVSLSYVRRNAEISKVDYNDEITLVIVHGVLHLVGYDHDTEEREREMWREQETLARRYNEIIQGGLMSA